MKTCKKLEKTRKWKLVAEDFASQKWSSLFRDEFFSYVSGKPLYCIKYHSSSIINSKHNLNIFIPFSLKNNKQHQQNIKEDVTRRATDVQQLVNNASSLCQMSEEPAFRAMEQRVRDIHEVRILDFCIYFPSWF